MDLKLPMVVVHRSARLVEAWLPHFPGMRHVGPSLAAIRDDLALEIMLRFEQESVDDLGTYQLPPHLALRHVAIDVVVNDRERKRKVTLKARLGVLLEKWPADDFWVATPTRLPAARFALRSPDDLDAALPRRMVEWALEHGLESLEPYHAEKRERLDLLEVDADPPSILPRGPKRPPRKKRKKKGDTGTAAGRAKDAANEESPADVEEKRRRRRLTVRTLRAVARNLSHAAQDDSLERAFGREALVRGLVEELEGREGVALVLVGPSGCGKTAIVHELVRRLVARQQAAGTRRDVWRVDGNRFIAGMMYVGQWEARARQLCEELVETGDVLYVDDLASLVYTGRTRSSDTNVAQFLEPHIARGELTIIAESTAERFAKLREEAPNFASLFRAVHVAPMTDRETLPVLLGVLRDLEGDAGGDGLPIRLSPAALEVLLQTIQRFHAHEAFPGKGVRLLRRVVAGAGQVRDGVRRFEIPQVYAAVKQQTGLPDFVLGNQPPRTREEIRRDLAAMVAGQPDAVDAVTDAILAMQHSLQDPEKPLATYLFVGPTGVGKTETAKALAKYLFGSPERMLRFDMSEFVSSASITRLVGTPGAPDGELTTALRTQPFCVILLDEIEKAHPRVFDSLLQLLGEGRLTDAAGRTADARQAVIIMTSNLGVREAAAQPGFVRGEAGAAQAHYVGAVRAFFRPEFFNRLDRVVAFRSLDPAALRIVVEHAMQELLSRRGIRRGNVLVDVEPELLDLLVEQAFDPRFGARPLKRALERQLTVPLAHHLVRRRSTDLALVELYRKADGMGLAVRLLREPTPVPLAQPLPSEWELPHMLAALAEARTTIHELSASAHARKLADARRAALDAAAAGGSAWSAGMDLLDRLVALEEELREIDDTELADLQFSEEADPAAERELSSGYFDMASHNKGRGGLRPRPGYRDVPVSVNPDVVLRRVRHRVVALRDGAEVMAHQLRAAATRGDEQWTVLIECVGEFAREPLDYAAHVPPFTLARMQRYDEVILDGPPEWKAQPYYNSGARVRRLCFALEGPGLRELVAPLEGYGLMEVVRDGLPRTVPVRLSVLAGYGPDAVKTHDAATLAVREARRAVSVADEPPATAPSTVAPATLVLRQPGRATVPIHLATGFVASAHLAIAAAVLRAARTAGSGKGKR